jgi:hypothetical protein
MPFGVHAMSSDKREEANGEARRERRSLLAIVQQWQVFVALLVAIVGLWFTFVDQNRKAFELNREAVLAAQSETTLRLYAQDPQNTLMEFRAIYPQHAFCSALNTFIAQTGRASGDADSAETARSEAEQALLVQVETLAAAQGMRPDNLAALIDRADAEGDRGPDAICPKLEATRPVTGRLERPLAPRECLLALTTFAQNRCNSARRAALFRLDSEVEQVSLSASPPPRYAEPDGRPPAAAVEAPAAWAEGPGEACGEQPPLVFPHFVETADRERVTTLRERLVQAGWRLAPIDRVTGRTAGDVRIYREEDRACGERLAAVVADELGLERFAVISLAERYRSLPAGQMELWLPTLPRDDR